MMQKIAENAKAIATLVGAIAVALIVNGVSGAWETELTVISVIAAAVVTWATPNADKVVVEPVQDYEPQHALDEHQGELDYTEPEHQ